MKKSIKSIAAFAAALTMTFSCIPKAFAVEDAPAVQTEAEEEKTGFEFTEGKTFETPYNGVAKIADENGTVYYRGHDNANRCAIFYTLDENGKIKNSYSVKNYVNDKGEMIGSANCEIKQCGDYIYILYEESNGFSIGEHIIVKLDKELNEVARYKAPKCDGADTNGEKIVYLKNHNTIYSMDMDGKNKQKLYTLDDQMDVLNFLAVSGDYAGFIKTESGVTPKDQKDYCVYINLKTDEVTQKEQKALQQLYGSKDKIIWYRSEWYDTRDSYMITVPEGEDPSEYIRKHDEEHRKYFKDGESYILDNGEYYVLKTQSPNECYELTIDDDGNVITSSYKNGKYIFKFYRDNKLIDTYSMNLKGYCGFTANNGVLTICYTGRDMTAEDWVGITASSPEELQELQEQLQEQLDKTPAAKETVKSVTIYYK